MNYHNITMDDMLNGDGLRTVLWVSGCAHHCRGCQNPQTWNPQSGIPFDDAAKEELFSNLSRDYINGVTFSGGNPLCSGNRETVGQLITEIHERFPQKTIWLYTGDL
ncbi:MAG: 4Fe-4S cluster-binding domain-containing protein, partial [Christensenellales bacterium]